MRNKKKKHEIIFFFFGKAKTSWLLEWLPYKKGGNIFFSLLYSPVGRESCVRFFFSLSLFISILLYIIIICWPFYLCCLAVVVGLDIFFSFRIHLMRWHLHQVLKMRADHVSSLVHFSTMYMYYSMYI